MTTLAIHTFHFAFPLCLRAILQEESIRDRCPLRFGVDSFIHGAGLTWTPLQLSFDKKFFSSCTFMVPYACK